MCSFQMGRVSGFVVRSEGSPTLYVAGDTIWCDEVEEALLAHRPDVIVVNAGAARFLEGEPITMTAEDVAEVCRAAPEARVIVSGSWSLYRHGEVVGSQQERTSRHAVAGRHGRVTPVHLDAAMSFSSR